MAPFIEVSDETLRTLNPTVYTLRNDLVPKQDVETPQVEVVSEPYIEVPELGLAIAKQTTHFNETQGKQKGLLTRENARMLETQEFVGFRNFLATHPENREYQEILDEIEGVRAPWRGENLDAYFVRKQGKLWIVTQRNPEGEPLEDCLMEDGYADVWGSANSQGLPTESADSGTYFWYPREDSVARLGADPGGSGLGCNDGPGCRGPALGVRAAKQLKQ